MTDCDPCHIVDRGAVADKSHATEICSFPQACNVLLSQADLFLWASLADSVWRLVHLHHQCPTTSWGKTTMRAQNDNWLDYATVAFAVLVVALGVWELRVLVDLTFVLWE